MCSHIFEETFKEKEIKKDETAAEEEGASDDDKGATINVKIDKVDSADYFEDFLAMISPDRQILINRRNYSF